VGAVTAKLQKLKLTQGTESRLESDERDYKIEYSVSVMSVNMPVGW